MNIRLLNKADFDQLHKSFMLAFSGYQVNLSPTREEFHDRIFNKLNIDFELSAGAFDGDDMVGFILHSSNIYKGLPTAYNGGTGVIPGFRNQQMAEDIYRFLIPKIRQKALARIVLEVIDSNANAIRLYEKLGFVKQQKFLCYKLNTPISSAKEIEIEVNNITTAHDRFFDFDTSFIDNPEQLEYNQANEIVLRALNDGETAGFLVFQPALGRISQLSIAKALRKQGYGKALLFKAQELSKKNLSILNIPEDQFAFHNFLVSCGFTNEVNQYEMELIL